MTILWGPIKQYFACVWCYSGLLSTEPCVGHQWSLWITSNSGYSLPPSDFQVPGRDNHGMTATGLLAWVGLLSDRVALGRDTMQLQEKGQQEGSAGHLLLLGIHQCGITSLRAEAGSQVPLASSAAMNSREPHHQEAEKRASTSPEGFSWNLNCWAKRLN